MKCQAEWSTILIPACVSSSPAFLMMYSAYKLNKQGDNIQPWRTPFPIWNQSIVPCPVLTVASWPAYRFLKSGYRTGKGQFSFQSQRKTMPKNAQTTAQSHSPHTIVRECSKFSNPGFSNTWTMNFPMFKLALERAEEPEIKLPTSAGSLQKH